MDGKSEVPQKKGDKGEEIVATTRAVTEHRLGRFPIPTNKTSVEEWQVGLEAEWPRHFTALSTEFEHAGTTELYKVGILYDWMFRSDVTQGELFQANRFFSSQTYAVVLAPFVSAYNPELDEIFEQCNVLRCPQLRQISSGGDFDSDYFYQGRDRGQTTAVNSANFYSSQIYNNLKKVAHVILSNVAAATYDENYGKDNFGTYCYRELEGIFLERQINRSKAFRTAVELGCGTGHHSLSLFSRFEAVDGYDFSSRMIEEADRKRNEKVRRQEIKVSPKHRLEFHTRDVEMQPLDKTDIDMVAGLFGMGSFVEDLDAFLINCHSMLAMNGRIILSFYNSEATVYRDPPPWRHPALSAELDSGADELTVRLTPALKFRIYCKAWTVQQVKEKLELHFTDVEIITCPKIAAVFPRDYPGGAKTVTAELLMSAERALMDVPGPDSGPYILATGVKSATGLRTQYYLPPAEAANIFNGQIRDRNCTQVQGFFDPEKVRSSGDMNLDVTLGLWWVDDPERLLPLAYVRPHGEKLKGPQLTSLIGRRTWKLLKGEDVRAVFGAGLGAAPTGVFKGATRVILDPKLRDIKRFRLRVADRFLQTSSLECVEALVGGRQEWLE